MTDPDTVDVCPYCKDTNYETRKPSAPSTNPSDTPQYHCLECDRRFNNVITRPSKGHRHAGSGGELAAKLAAMDPEEVPGND